MNRFKEKIYVIGHTNPDLDSIASAVGYSQYMESRGFFNYIPIRCGQVNPLTEWVFKKYDIPRPQYMPNISGMNVVLVDHTYPENRAKGWEMANILEVIDHHDVKLEDIIPKKILIRPCGSTSTLISEMFFKGNIPIKKDIANILLAAILDDTLGLKSPTTIKLDIDMVNRLKDICKAGDITEFTKEIFKKKDIWNTLNAREIIEMDIKEVEINGNTVAISQVETLNGEDIDSGGIIEELKILNMERELPLRVVMLTDLQKKECTLLIVGKDIRLLEKEIGRDMKDNTVILPNVVSRKKQILPILESMYKGA